jgi:hypothetical protein
MVRSPIAVYYLGAYYKEVFAPWHYAVVMTLLTTPALVLAAAALGLARCWKEWRGRPAQARLDALMALTVAVPLLAATNPGMSRYDGVRLWLSAFPFLAVLAGRGAGWAWDAATAHWGARSWRAWLPAAAAACWLALPMGLMHPFQLSYYSELAGGPWGARRLGMETTYWFDTLTPRALAFLNEGLPRPKRVAFIPDEDRIYWMYRLDGYLGEDVQLSRLEHEWDYLVVVPRQGFIRSPDDPQMVALTRLMETRTPVWQEWLTPLRDIPVCLIYRNDRRH